MNPALAERDARIVALHDAGGRTRREIADAVGVTLPIVKNALRERQKFGREQEITLASGMSIRPPDPQDRAGFADRIITTWRESVLAVIETGRLIAAAKDALPHGEFVDMVERDLPFSRSTAHRLMAIASDPKLSNVAHVQHLPSSWGTLYELTKLDDVTFEAKLADGTIRPDMERRDIGQMRKATARIVREELLGRSIKALPQERFGVIVADPAWRFGPYSRETGMDRAADNHYPTMTLPQIMRLPVASSIAADDCALFLWTPVALLIEALYVAEAWGFLDLGDRAERAALIMRPQADDEDWTRFQIGDPNRRYKSQAVWHKLYAGAGMGTGYWFRNEHEVLLLFTRGSIPAPSMGTQYRSVIEAAVGRHSEKPEAFLELIERYFPTLPKIELNRRGPARPGWAAWGNEVEEIASSGPDAPSGVPEGRNRAAEPASRLSDGRTSDATEVAGRDSPERRAPPSPPPTWDDLPEIPAFLRRQAVEPVREGSR